MRVHADSTHALRAMLVAAVVCLPLIGMAPAYASMAVAPNQPSAVNQPSASTDMGDRADQASKIVGNLASVALCPGQPGGKNSTGNAGTLAALFEGSDFSQLTCMPVRYTQALAQGAIMAQDAHADGATCAARTTAGHYVPDHSDTPGGRLSPGQLWVCTSAHSLWAQRGGTTYGNTFLTPRTATELDASPNLGSLLSHEYRHYLQWQLLGAQFPLAYTSAGTNACTNVFEQAAGLRDGSYNCPN